MADSITFGYLHSYEHCLDHHKCLGKMKRSRLKKVFSSDIGVDPSYQVLDILEYACGLILGFVLISTENPNFEMTSKRSYFAESVDQRTPFLFCISI
jgi:hypothetical protein